MTDFEEETYSTVFTSLRHPIRRRSLRTLSAGPQSFTDLQRASGMESPHLTYHLEGLGSLLVKTDDGKYALSALGMAAVSMMKQAEEPRNTAFPRVSFSPRKWKLLTLTLAMIIIVLSAAFLFEYQNLTAPSNQPSSMVDKYSVTSSVETALAKNETSKFDPTSNISSSIAIAICGPGHTKVYSLSSLADNSTLEIEMQVLNPLAQGTGISLTVFADTIHPTVAYVGTLINDSDPLSFNASQQVVQWAHSYDMIWSGTAVDRDKFSVQLPEAGSYYLLVRGPLEWNGTDYHTIEYKMTLQIQYQENYVPFFIRSEQEDYYPLLLA